MKFCGLCGSDVSHLKAPEDQKGEARVRHCVECGRSIDWGANLCPYCGNDYRSEQYTAKNANVGGILTIIASVVSIFLLVYLYLSTHQYQNYNYYYYSPPVNYDWMLYMFLGGMGIVGIIGGICAIGKVYYSMAVVGGACSIIGPGFFFGIPGLVTIVGSAKEFSRPKKYPASDTDYQT